MKKDYLLELIRSKTTVFTTKDLSLLWEKTDADFLKKKIHRYVKDGKILRIRQGIYSIRKEYDKNELAAKIFTSSYISLETVLTPLGVTNQLENNPICVVSKKNKRFEIDNQKYASYKIPASILDNQKGIEIHGNYKIATPERAFLDIIYLRRRYEFKNLYNIDWNKVQEIFPIYDANLRMKSELKSLFNISFKDYG